MNRFRFTFLVVCLALIYLGTNDLLSWSKNPEPTPISAAELISKGPVEDWVTVEGGILHLLDAANAGGDLPVEALMVPIRIGKEGGPAQIILQTQDADLIEAFSAYYISIETEAQRAEYLEKNKDVFFNPLPRTGMVTSGLIAANHRSRMIKLAKDLDLTIADNVIFLTEGKTPPPWWRGLFFFIVGVAGLFKLWNNWRSTQGPNAPTSSEEVTN